MTRRANVKLIFASVFLTDMVNITMIFTVDRDLAERGADLMALGLIGGTMGMAFAASCLVFGALSDRIGRWPSAVGGIGLMGLATCGCLVFSPPSWIYFGAYWAVGMGAGMYFPAVLAFLSQSGERRSRSRGISRPLIFFCFAWNGGVISGTALASQLFAWGRAWPIGVALAASGLNLLVLLSALAWPGRDPVPTAVRSDRDMLRHQELSVFFSRLAWTANLGGAFSMSMVFHLLPRLMVDLEIAADNHGWLIMSCRGCVLVTYLVLYRLAFWHYRFYFPIVTQLLAVGGLVIVILADSIWQIGLGLAALGVLVGYNYFASLYYSTAGGGPKRQGLASGIHEASLGFGFAMGSIAGGLFARLTEAFGHVLPSVLVQRSPYVLATSVITVLLVLQCGMYRRRREEMRGKRIALSAKAFGGGND